MCGRLSQAAAARLEPSCERGLSLQVALSSGRENLSPHDAFHCPLPAVSARDSLCVEPAVKLPTQLAAQPQQSIAGSCASARPVKHSECCSAQQPRRDGAAGPCASARHARATVALGGTALVKDPMFAASTAIAARDRYHLAQAKRLVQRPY